MEKSDWKEFNRILPELRERYLRERNKELIVLLIDESKTPTERFWAVEEKAEKEAKILRKCLDGFSKSQAPLYIMNLCHYGFMKKEDLAGFSDEIKSLVANIENFQ